MPVIKPYKTSSVVECCKGCGIKLPPYHPHHYKCQRCWEEEQELLGNSAHRIVGKTRKM